jgi:YD repeat-containing protein
MTSTTRTARRSSRFLSQFLGSIWALVITILATSLVSAQGGNISYIYDELGRLIAVVDQNGETARYAYDAVGNLLSISRQSSSTVSIIIFTPASGSVGSPVIIYGTAFSSAANQNTVTFNGLAATVVSASPTQIVTNVPVGATTGPIVVGSLQGRAFVEGDRRERWNYRVHL